MRRLLLLLLTSVACVRVDAPSTAPSPMTLTYLGTAGWQLATPRGTLLVDPYLSRIPWADDTSPIVPDETKIAEHTPARADVILVSHSHFDHVLDVPLIAKRTGAYVVGTESTANLARASGVAEDHVVIARDAEVRTYGPFLVRAIAGLHSLTGQRQADIPPAAALPMPIEGYVEGGTLQYLVRAEGKSILFVGSANFREEKLDGLRPDVAVVAVGLREKVPDYTCRLMRALRSPPLVLANHFDAFTEKLGPKQMDISAGAKRDLEAFPAEVKACAPGTRVLVPTHLTPISI